MTAEEDYSDFPCPHVHAGLFIDFWVSKFDNLCIYTGVPAKDVEACMGLTSGYVNRVVAKRLLPNEVFPNFTLGIFLDLLCRRPDLIYFDRKAYLEEKYMAA